MKRSWIGCGMLLVLLALCLVTGYCLDRLQGPLTQELKQAAALALAEEWPQAKALAENAQSSWNRCRKRVACVTDHTPMEEIDELFAQLSCYDGDREEYAALCVSLAQGLQAIAAAHSLTWWSFF